MSRPPTSPHATWPAPNHTPLLLPVLLLFSSLLGHSSAAAANSQPAPLPTLHAVVAPGVTAAAAAAAAAAPPSPPAADRNHYNHAVHDQRDRQQQQQQPSGPYTPLVTPAPSAVSDDQALRDQGFRQETFYTCMTAPSGREHCGWHTPVLKQAKQGSAAAAVMAPRQRTDVRVVVAAVMGLTAVFVVGMM